MHRLWHAPMLAACGLLIGVVPGCEEATRPETNIEGKRLYEQYCARCHGSDGGGVVGADDMKAGSPEQLALAKPLNDAARMRLVNDDMILGVIRGGRPPAMPGFAEEFTEAKIMVIAAYVRSLSGTPGTKAPQREEVASWPKSSGRGSTPKVGA